MAIHSHLTERSLAAQAGERDPDILFVGDPHGRFEHVVELAFTRIPGLPAPAPLLETPAAGRRRTQVDANAK